MSRVGGWVGWMRVWKKDGKETGKGGVETGVEEGEERGKGDVQKGEEKKGKGGECECISGVFLPLSTGGGI